MKFIKVPEIGFSTFSETVIYNVDDGEMKAVEWLPNSNANFYVMMDDKHMRRVVSYGHDLLDGEES